MKMITCTDLVQFLLICSNVRVYLHHSLHYYVLLITWGDVLMNGTWGLIWVHSIFIIYHVLLSLPFSPFFLFIWVHTSLFHQSRRYDYNFDSLCHLNVIVSTFNWMQKKQLQIAYLIILSHVVQLNIIFFIKRKWQ